MKPVLAAFYLRMSSTGQELSIDQQREELKKLAEREGYAVVAEYVDAGKSGSKDTHKRTEFLRMIADAQKEKFVALLVWDTSRFGRLSSFKSAKYVDLLIDAGVFLHSVKEGRFDWRTDQGEMMWNMFCLGNKRYSTSLSENAIRGRADIASRGLWASGKVPFGYDRQYVDLTGNVMKVVARNERFSKPRGWHLTLKVNDREAEVVRTIFTRFSREEVSLRAMAFSLNDAGAVCGGDKWTAGLVKMTLTNSAYVGRSYFGQRSHKSQAALNRAGDHTKDGACPALVDVATWDKVQDLLSAREKNNTKPKTASAGLLSGFLFCGHCGRRMEKKNSHGKVTYTCATANKIKGGVCKGWSVDETEVGAFVVDQLERHVGRELLKLAEAKPEKKSDAYPDLLRVKIGQLKKKVENGRRNALAADPDDAEAMFNVLAEWNAELRQAEADLALHSSAPAVNWLTWWDENRNQLVALWKSEVSRQTPVKVAVAVNDGSGWEGDEPPILTDATKLKGLLRLIGLEVRLWWKEADKPETMSRGRWRKYRISRRKVSVQVAGKEDVFADDEGERICVEVESVSTTGVDILAIVLRA